MVGGARDSGVDDDVVLEGIFELRLGSKGKVGGVGGGDSTARSRGVGGGLAEVGTGGEGAAGEVGVAEELVEVCPREVGYSSEVGSNDPCDFEVGFTGLRAEWLEEEAM